MKAIICLHKNQFGDELVFEVVSIKLWTNLLFDWLEITCYTILFLSKTTNSGIFLNQSTKKLAPSLLINLLGICLLTSCMWKVARKCTSVSIMRVLWCSLIPLSLCENNRNLQVSELLIVSCVYSVSEWVSLFFFFCQCGLHLSWCLLFFYLCSSRNVN